jgi:hypothetical protein
LGDLTKQVVVKSPRATVFDFVASPWNAPKYISSIKRILSGPDGAPVVNQTWRAEANFLGQPSIIDLRLKELRAPGRVGYRIEGEPEATLSLRLAEAEDPAHTRVALTLEVPSVPSILLGALMSPLLSGDMRRLKELLEK